MLDDNDDLRQSFDTAVTDATAKKAQKEADKKITLSEIWALVADDFRKDKSFQIVRDHTKSFDGVSISANEGIDKITVVDNRDGTFSIGDSKKTSPKATLAALGYFYGQHKKAPKQ